MSRTIKFAKAGGPEVLEFVEVQVPAPGPNEVRIKVKAIGINRAEAMWRVDDYIEPVKFPAGLGYEAAGIVDAVGKDVSGFAVGDEVNVIPSFSLNDYATYGEVILVPDHAVVRQPKSLSFTEAASIWMMFVTAYGALIEDAKVTKGDFVLIPAASSSVGLAAIQIANYAGATTIALTRTSTKKQQLLDAGAVHVIATEEVDLVGEVMRITNGQGARVAFDPVGGPSFPKADLGAGLRWHHLHLRPAQHGRHPAAGARDDRQGANHQGAQHLAHKWKRDPPQGRNRVRHQGAGDRRAQARHRPYLHLRRDGGCAPLSRAERSVREDRGDCLKVRYGHFVTGSGEPASQLDDGILLNGECAMLPRQSGGRGSFL